jgi:hypothetical protein
MTEEEQNEEQKKALLTLAIELGDKKKQLLNIYLDSKPEQLAYDFCLQNNLDFDSMQNLTEEIKNALSNYKSEPNQELKNQISEEVEQTTSNKKNKGYDANESENNEVPHEIDNDEHQHEEKNENMEKKEEENNGIQSGPKTEEISEENQAHVENKSENHEKEEIQSKEQENEKGQKNDVEHEEEQLIENKDDNKNNENKENKENKEDNNLNNDNNNNEVNNENENENEKNQNKKEENEEELAKEEEGDEMVDMNENEEEEDNIPSYLSPTICFQYKQRQIVQPKEKPEYTDFDTTFKKKDKNKEFAEEINEKVVNKLNINQNNQKYLPKDYYDNPDGKNFGERLYHKELKLKEEAMEKIKNKIEKENKEKEDNLTFTPKINEYNIIALQNRKNNNIQYNDEKRILYYKDYLKTKEEHTKNKILEECEKDNTFMPKINPKSQKMAEAGSSHVPRYEQLYKKKLDLKKLEEKIYDDPNMFKPKINKNYKGGNKKMTEYASLTFEERQKKFREKVEEKRGKLMEKKNTNIDVKTGKKYFKPTINKNKKLENERKNKPVFNQLYSDSEKYKIKKEELEKKVLELEQFKTEFKASVRSEEMYDKQKNIAFEKIFKRLDDDKDGKISKDDIDLYGISKRIVKIISPILDELKNGKGTISSEEFIKKCEIIYKGLNYADKKELFIYSMGGPIKSVYDTEPYARRKKVERKSKGKSLRSTSKGINGNNSNQKFLKGDI